VEGNEDKIKREKYTWKIIKIKIKREKYTQKKIKIK
jgi:hypothetical protein